MKKQTAVEYLFQLIDDFGIKKIDRKSILEIEKKQIIDSYNNCIKDRYNNALVDIGFKEKSEKCYNTGQEYYKQNYENNL